LQELPAPKDEFSEGMFTDFLRGLVMDRLNIPGKVQRGIASLKDARRTPLTSVELEQLDDALYDFFLGRVGLRFLVEHHIACDPRSKGSLAEPGGTPGGLIKKDLNPVLECKDVAREIEEVLAEKFDVSPRIEVVGMVTDVDQDEVIDERTGRKVKYFKRHPGERGGRAKQHARVGVR
jgi:hypothetical protein